MPRPYLALAALALATACQSYKFEEINAQPVVVVNQQVPITARHKPPVIMIVQDTSGSMCEAIQAQDASGNACVATSGSSDPNYCSFCQAGDTSSVATSADCDFGGATEPPCATKMQLTAYSINSILGELKPAAGQLFMGLTSFPTGSSCGTGSIVVPVGDATQTIPQIENFYTNIANQPSGGTPTAATLATVVPTDPKLSNPDPSVPKYVLLVTDGLPNCNPNEACATEPWSDGTAYGCASPNLVAAAGHNATPPAGCSCSFGDCPDANNGNTCCPVNTGGVPAGDYCLDGPGSVSAVQSLATQGIQTIVVGMGFDYQAGAAQVLDNMMAAGGSGLNGGQHFQADDPATLLSVLQTIIQSISKAGCSYTLDPAPVSGLVTVTLGGQELVPNDPNGFTYDSSTATLTINGSACSSITDGGVTENLEITAIAQ